MPATHELEIEINSLDWFKADITFGANPDATLVDPTADIPEMNLEERSQVNKIVQEIARLELLKSEVTKVYLIKK